MADKQVFKMKKYLDEQQQFAASLGLPFAPELPQMIVDRHPQQLDENTQFADSDDELNKRVLGGVIPDIDSKNIKINRKLDKLKKNICLKASGKKNDISLDLVEENEKNLTRREKRQAKIQEVKEKHTLSGVADEEFLVEKKQDESAPTDPDFDWRNDPRVYRALRKQRVIIRADGTAKIQGASGMIPQKHLVFTDEGQSHDTLTFAGVVATLANKEDSPRGQGDQATKRQEFIEKMQARMKAANEEIKADKSGFRKKTKITENQSIQDLEAAVLAKLSSG